MPENEYTRSQLALHNGQDSPTIWIAYKGVIYDVTHSRYFTRGIHYSHWAGQDLTDELEQAPHNDVVFRKLTVIGKLV